MKLSRRQIAKMIDHTNVRPYATVEDVRRLCEEALKFSFWSVCINPSYVPLAARLLKGTEVKVCAAISFPLGASMTEVKVFEARRAIEGGAGELDVVMNIGAFKSGNYELVKRDIEAVVGSSGGSLVKVIIETGYLSDEEIAAASRIVEEAGAGFVKTCTGFGPRGVTPSDIEIIRKAVSHKIGVKASGGIRTLKDALAMVKAGAERIGTSASVAIIEEAEEELAS